MPRYVILEHDHPALHWDLMLDTGAALKTWRLAAPPPVDPSKAAPIGAHRRMYLDYEGPVSGNRGMVRRWDQGEYEILEENVTTWLVRLLGSKWQGIVSLPLR